MQEIRLGVIGVDVVNRGGNTGNQGENEKNKGENLRIGVEMMNKKCGEE